MVDRSTKVRIAALLTAVLSVALAGPAASQRAAQPGPDPAAGVDAYIARVLSDWALPGIAVAVVRNDSVVFARGYGVRELGRPERVDEHTAFDAASLTKSFTSAAAAMLVDEGKMQWDAPVRTYLPELQFMDPYLTSAVTMRDLLSHRTGLRGSNLLWRFTGHSRDEVLARARYIAPQAPFRSGWVYSNVGYTIAGEAAARVAGQPWEALIRQRILDPLGMTDSFLWAEWGRHPASLRNVASAHAMIDGRQQVIDRRDGAPDRDGRNSTAPAGSLQASAVDLARWMRFQLAGGVVDGRRLVSEAALGETQAPQLVVPSTAAFRASRQLKYFPAYGLGWQVWDYRGRPMLWHSGAGNGQYAYMAMLPGERLGVVVLVNSWRSGVVHGNLASYILDAYLGEQGRDYSAEALRADSASLVQEAARRRAFAAAQDSVRPPLRALGEFVGAYVDTLYGEVTIAREGRGLRLRLAQGEVADLEPWRGDTLRVRWRTPLFREQFSSLAVFPAGTGAAPSVVIPLGRDTVRAFRP
ncbi:MAG TPA: serine hydrolase [Longimicrobium sp.]|jgi:CubicO group peptidase (beta-lactamase class C family)